MFWGQRTFIEYLLQSPNETLRTRWLDPLLSGELAGATGLSNAMKYLRIIEPLQMKARLLDHAGEHDQGRSMAACRGSPTCVPQVSWLPRHSITPRKTTRRRLPLRSDDAPGVTRSEDLDLIALRSSNTAALRWKARYWTNVTSFTADAPAWLARVRPGFLGLQCGMSIGLARRCLAAVGETSAVSRAAVEDESTELARELEDLTHRLKEGVRNGAFVSTPAALFEIRIALAAVVEAAVGLEVQVPRRPRLFPWPDRHRTPHARGRLRPYRYAWSRAA